ncbi:hypothetical protein QJS66_13010 [Kocuria rhizophila]|nr:hypothetical protein QJS66_13010 [Kocuria rhizophila]
MKHVITAVQAAGKFVGVERLRAGPGAGLPRRGCGLRERGRRRRPCWLQGRGTWRGRSGVERSGGMNKPRPSHSRALRRGCSSKYAGCLRWTVTAGLWSVHD